MATPKISCGKGLVQFNHPRHVESCKTPASTRDVAPHVLVAQNNGITEPRARICSGELKCISMNEIAKDVIASYLHIDANSGLNRMLMSDDGVIYLETRSIEPYTDPSCDRTDPDPKISDCPDHIVAHELYVIDPKTIPYIFHVKGSADATAFEKLRCNGTVKMADVTEPATDMTKDCELDIEEFAERVKIVIAAHGVKIDSKFESEHRKEIILLRQLINP